VTTSNSSDAVLPAGNLTGMRHAGRLLLGVAIATVILLLALPRGAWPFAVVVVAGVAGWLFISANDPRRIQRR
jgi:chromate transport protein ChrA